MSNRLAFQTQLASIMEVLANAAVAEICKLVDDDYAVVSVQMSQCQRENKALKRKLHLLELKMARGFAERRLRDSATNNGRPRVHQLHHLGTNDKFRGSSSSSGGVFERQVDMGLWPGGPAPQDVTTETAATVVKQDTSADVELVEPEEALVKQERMEDGETGEEELEEVQLIGEDGQVERGPLGGGGRRASHLLQDVPAVYQQKEAPGHIPGRQASTRGVEAAGVQKEEEPDVMLVKEEAGQDALGHAHPTIIIQEGLVESSTDDYRAGIPLDALDQAVCQSLKELQECGRGFSEPPETPKANPSVLEDACSIVSVHTGAPDVSTAANNSTSHQPQRSSSGSSLSSEYSVLDLENLFTRWAPDSGAPPAGPSCSTAREVSAEEEEEDRVIIEEEEQEAPLMRGGGSQRSSRTHSFHTITPAVSTGSSLSAALPLQAPPPQLTWSRATAMMRTAQTQSLQQGRHGDRTALHRHHLPHNTLNSMATAGVSGGHVGGARIRGLSNFPGSSALPPTGLQTRGYAGKGLSGASALLAGVSTELDGVGVGLESVGIGSDGVSTGLEGVNMGIALQHHVRPFGHSAAGSCERRKRNYVCRACGKAFSGLSNLEAHQRVHTGEKPFSCATCGKRFSEAGNLKKHQRVHTGEKPYSCELCGKRFAWICNLRTHQQSGAGCGGAQ